VVQMVAHLPSKCNVLSSIPSTTRKGRVKGGRERERERERDYLII
jgi:hypothetical protein